MESIVRAVLVYLFLQLVLRFAGNKTLGQMSSFDFVLLLIISESTQQALMSQDFSVLNSFIVITALIGTDIVLSQFKRYSPKLERWMEGIPTLLVDNGKVLTRKLEQNRLDESDIMESARINHGLSQFSQIKYAILEKSGEISIIPKLLS